MAASENSEPPSGPSSASLASALSLLSGGSDAESTLVEGLLDHSLIMSARATRAATFLQAYGLEDTLAFILQMRRYQTRPAQIVKALDAVSLKKFMGRLDINLGNK